MFVDLAACLWERGGGGGVAKRKLHYRERGRHNHVLSANIRKCESQSDSQNSNKTGCNSRLQYLCTLLGINRSTNLI